MNKIFTILLLGILMVVNTSIAQNVDPNNPFKSPNEQKAVQVIKSTVPTTSTVAPKGSPIQNAPNSSVASSDRPVMIQKTPVPTHPPKFQSLTQTQPVNASPLVPLKTRSEESSTSNLPIISLTAVAPNSTTKSVVKAPEQVKQANTEQLTELFKIEIE